MKLTALNVVKMMNPDKLNKMTSSRYGYLIWFLLVMILGITYLIGNPYMVAYSEVYGVIGICVFFIQVYAFCKMIHVGGQQ